MLENKCRGQAGATGAEHEQALHFAPKGGGVEQGGGFAAGFAGRRPRLPPVRVKAEVSDAIPPWGPAGAGGAASTRRLRRAELWIKKEAEVSDDAPSKKGAQVKAGRCETQV